MSAIIMKRPRRKRYAETAAQFSERIGKMCDDFNADAPQADGRSTASGRNAIVCLPGLPCGTGSEHEAEMLEVVKAMKRHINRLDREKRLIALHMGTYACPEGKDGCPLKDARPAGSCASCWEIWAAKR